MTHIHSEYLIRRLDNDRFVQMTAPFHISSDVLKDAGFSPDLEIQTDFVMDEESVPIVRGRNARGGAVHDYLSCNDSIPLVTKSIAASVYLEVNAYCDSIDAGRSRLAKGRDFVRRWSKWTVVRVWPRYFHKRSIFATPFDILGIEGDPYTTVEKLEAAIVKSKEVTAVIKAVPDQIVEKSAMVEASKQITEGLKDAKVDAVVKEAETKII